MSATSLKLTNYKQVRLRSDLGQSSVEGELPLTGIERSLTAPTRNSVNVDYR